MSLYQEVPRRTRKSLDLEELPSGDRVTGKMGFRFEDVGAVVRHQTKTGSWSTVAAEAGTAGPSSVDNHRLVCSEGRSPEGEAGWRTPIRRVPGGWRRGRDVCVSQGLDSPGGTRSGTDRTLTWTTGSEDSFDWKLRRVFRGRH